jgi:hypothetical protein
MSNKHIYIEHLLMPHRICASVFSQLSPLSIPLLRKTHQMQTDILFQLFTHSRTFLAETKNEGHGGIDVRTIT